LFFIKQLALIKIRLLFNKNNGTFIAGDRERVSNTEKESICKRIKQCLYGSRQWGWGRQDHDTAERVKMFTLQGDK